MNYCKAFREGIILKWNDPDGNIDYRITDIELAVADEDDLFDSDIIYFIKYNEGRSEAEVFHNEISVE